IRARLRVVSLDDYPCPYYEALSYAWGSTGSTAPVKINDHTLHITLDAFAALESLRLRRATRTIWIDSICIDQNNDNEKDVQLPLMGDVYQSAAVVNVWLGSTKEHHEASLRVGNLFNPELWSRAAIETNDLWHQRLWVVQEYLLAK
ncbi:heterokaryon incompatibility, partial [Pyrenochaeta sp. DS3sAY3a]